METEIAGRSLEALHVWGWHIPAYLFLGGLAAGTMVVAARISKHVPLERQSQWMRWLPFLAPLVLSAGMGALLLDLESKIHVFRFYTAFRITSPMSWGAWILLLIYPATLLFGLARLTDGEVARLPGVVRLAALRARPWIVRIESVNLVLGIALGAYTGILLATLGARALWSSALLGPLFLVSGLSTGAALVMLLPLAHEEHEAVRRFDLVAIAAELVVLGLFFVHLAVGGMRGHAAAALFFGGPWTASFWVLVVIAGLLVPLTLELMEKRLALKASAITSLLLLGGGFGLRWILVAAGQAL
jgi:formate-dependent nitrite reductase membrane component NrfD